MGDVLHGGGAARRGDALPCFGVSRVVHRALGERGAWGDGVHGDLVRGQLQHEATGQHLQPSLGHAVGGEVAVRLFRDRERPAVLFIGEEIKFVGTLGLQLGVFASAKFLGLVNGEAGTGRS